MGFLSGNKSIPKSISGLGGTPGIPLEKTSGKLPHYGDQLYGRNFGVLILDSYNMV